MSFFSIEYKVIELKQCTHNDDEIAEVGFVKGIVAIHVASIKFTKKNFHESFTV